MTIQQVAKKLNLTMNWVRTLVHMDKLKATRLKNRSFDVDADSVRAYQRERERP